MELYLPLPNPQESPSFLRMSVNFMHFTNACEIMVFGPGAISTINAFNFSFSNYKFCF